MNGLLNLIIQSGNIDNDFISQHTVGFEELRKIVSKWTPESAEQASGELGEQATCSRACQNPTQGSKC
jgi:anaerobic selenocysteine-containing dehydrogenase